MKHTDELFRRLMKDDPCSTTDGMIEQILSIMLKKIPEVVRDIRRINTEDCAGYWALFDTGYEEYRNYLIECCLDVIEREVKEVLK